MYIYGGIVQGLDCCRDCLRGMIETCEEPVVKCPHNDDDYSCPAHLLDCEIKHVSNERLLVAKLQY